MRILVQLPSLAVGCLLSIPAVSWSSDLREIYELALQNDPGYQAALIDNESDQINLPLAKTAFRPFVVGDAGYGRRRLEGSGSSSSSDDGDYGLNLDWPVYNRSDRLNIHQTENEVRISDLIAQNARHNLILRVANAYFNVLASKDAREVAQADKVAIQRQMDLASERLEVGLGTQTDLYDAKARFAQAEANIIAAQNLINNSIAELKRIIGVTPEALDPLRAEVSFELPNPDNLDSWIALSKERNIPLQIEKLNVEIAEQEIDIQRSERMPSVSVGANRQWVNRDSSLSSGAFTGSGFDSTSYGVSVEFPFWLGGQINLRTKQAGLQYNRAGELLDEAGRTATTQTTSAFLNVSSGVSQVEALYDAITAGESALEAKEEGFSAGLTTNIDVLDAQRDLSQSRFNYLRERYNYILSVLELERASGQLDEEDIERINTWLE